MKTVVKLREIEFIMDHDMKIIDGIFNCIKDDLGLSFKNLI